MIGAGFLGNLKAYLGLDISQYEKEISQAERDLVRFERAASNAGRQLATMGRQLTLTVTAPIAAIGVVGVKSFADFDKAMTESLAIISGVTEETRREMEALALTLSTKSTQAAKELGEAYYFLASAGYSAQASLEALPVVSKFAQAGAFNLSQATSMLADSVIAMGMSSKEAALNTEAMVRASDVLTKANILADASTSQFAAALTNKAATALRILNKDIEEGVAVLAAYANVGIKAEVAGQNLAMAYRDVQRAFQKSPDDWKKLGIEVFDTSGRMKHMADIIADMERAFYGMSDEMKRASITELGLQERSMMALLALVGMSDEIRRFDSELRQAGGTTEEVASKQMMAFANQMKAIWHEVQNAAIALGRVLAPAVLKVAQVVGKLAGWLENSPDTLKVMVIAVGALTAAIGPLLVVVGSLTANVFALTSALAALKIATITAAASGTQLTGLVGLFSSITIAGAAATAGVVALAAAVGTVAFITGKNISTGIIEWLSDIDQNAIAAGNMIEQMTTKNKDFQKSAAAYRVASQEVSRLRKELQSIEDIGGLKGQQTQLKLLEAESSYLENRRKILTQTLRVQEQLGNFAMVAKLQQNIRDLAYQWILVQQEIKKVSYEVGWLEDKQRRLNREKERALINEKTMKVWTEARKEEEMNALQEINKYEYDRLKILEDRDKAIKKLDEARKEDLDSQDEAVTDPQVYEEAKAAIERSAKIRLDVLEKAHKDELALALAVGYAKERLELQQNEQELLKTAQNEEEKLQIKKAYIDKMKELEQKRILEIQQGAATEGERRLMTLKEEYKQLLKIAETEKERAALIKGYQKERLDALAGLLRTEMGKIIANVPSRITGEEVGTIEAFRSEKGIDDETLKYQQEQIQLQQAQKDLLDKLSSQGVTIKDLQIASMRGR